MSGYTCGETKPSASPNKRINILHYMSTTMTKIKRSLDDTGRSFGYFTILYELRILCTTNDLGITTVIIIMMKRCEINTPCPI
jgi:hypothetical protein